MKRLTVRIRLFPLCRHLGTAKKRAHPDENREMAETLSESENRRRELIITIQNLYKNGNSIREISRITGKERKTVRKYLEGDPYILCRSNKHSPLDAHTNFIINSIKEGLTASAIAKQIKAAGSNCTLSNIRQFITSIAKEKSLAISKYCRTSPNYDSEGNLAPKTDHITRKGIFNHLWMKIELTVTHRDYLWKQYDVLPELDLCIREFRDIFDKKSMPRLYLFIERHSKSRLKEIASFAKGLLRDIAAVENAVASPLSNAFVEGQNSRVKTVKKSMYGRCSKLLLEAKLMYDPGY